MLRSTDLLALPAVDCDKAYAAQLSLEETLLTNQTVYFQVALLYPYLANFFFSKYLAFSYHILQLINFSFFFSITCKAMSFSFESISDILSIRFFS